MMELQESFRAFPVCSEGVQSAGGRPSESLEEAQAELERLVGTLSEREPEVFKDDDQEMTPVYLIISSKRNLTKKYAELGFRQLDQDLHELKQTIESQHDLEAVIAYAEDDSSLAPYDLQPVDPAEPEQIKKLIDDLDNCLHERGKNIRHILIIGGDSILPFYRLPNPADDQDADVPSDNPYASSQANYLVPERSIGRLPDGEEGGMEFLRSLIRTAIDSHRESAKAKKLWNTVSALLRSKDQSRENGNTLGYSASIWRRSSRAVFQIIGKDGSYLRTSPPTTCQDFDGARKIHLGYFNLHGTEDGPNWYGQRSPLFPADYPLFPVAIRPQDLVLKYSDSVIFTEACYGANILEKDASNSIALRFLDLQAMALVGSTKISYGAIEPPLIGADLLGKHFWEGLKHGLTVGEALKYAKVNFAKETQDRQGHLDGEDQKTLISFVLYGDPSLPVFALQCEEANASLIKSFCPSVICRKGPQTQKRLVSDELLASVKKRLELYLPHMTEAPIRAAPVIPCQEEDCAHCTSPYGDAKIKKGTPGSWALTLEKDIPLNNERTHHQVVRVTVNEKGGIMKLAVSK